MSSAGYEALLAPDERVRLGLLAASGGATVLGFVLVLFLPVVPLLKSALCLLWVLAGAAEARSFRRGMRRICRIGIRADGSVRGYARGGATHALRLLPGSIVLERVAWLRLGFEDGLAYGELLTGDPQASAAWRRLLVIWRHRADFGRSGRS